MKEGRNSRNSWRKEFVEEGIREGRKEFVKEGIREGREEFVKEGRNS